MLHNGAPAPVAMAAARFNLLRQATGSIAAFGSTPKRKLRRAGSVRFAEYDHDGATRMSFAELFALMPHTMRGAHSVDNIRAMVEAVDTHGTGLISFNAFFEWSLSSAAADFGAISLEKAFTQYDTTPSYMGKDGLLDADEFGVICSDLGFGHVAHDIFHSLDKASQHPSPHSHDASLKR